MTDFFLRAQREFTNIEMIRSIQNGKMNYVGPFGGFSYTAEWNRFMCALKYLFFDLSFRILAIQLIKKLFPYFYIEEKMYSQWKNSSEMRLGARNTQVRSRWKTIQSPGNMFEY